MIGPLVSVVIPTHNESGVIARNLRALKEQVYSNCEIIVVDDGSTDETVSVVKKFTRQVYPRAHAERSVQRNFGARRAKGEYLLFLDADMEVSRQVISDCVKTAQVNPRVGAIAIPERPIAINFLEKVKAFERSFYSQQGDPDTDAARFFTKTAFAKAGGYDESLIGPEDWDLPERIAQLGFQVGRVKSLINHYERVPSLGKLVKKKYYYALTTHRYLKNHKISPIGPKTIYFLRPVFYRNWRTMVRHPILTIGMIGVLVAELIGGAVGFVVGKVRSL